jgi:hypothetical protein
MLFTVVRYILGTLLAVTAVLKLHLLLTDPFADIATGSSLPILWLAVFIEGAVVYIVFSKVSKELKWAALFVLFVIMSGVSLYNVMTGKSDCGCSGTIAIPPVWFLAIDLLALAVLFACRLDIEPAKASETISRMHSNKTMGHLAAITLVGVLFIGIQTSFARDVLRSVLWKHDVSAIPVDLGTLKAEPIECELVLKNHSSTARKIVGINSSCSCVVPNDIVNSSIPSHGQLAVKVKVAPKSGRKFHQRLLFFLDSPQQYVVAADLFGIVKEK